MTTQVLLAHNHIVVNAPRSPALGVQAADAASLGTVLANLAYYGFAPSVPAVVALRRLAAEELGEFWLGVEPALRTLTGADRNMGDFVVYKNFPREVLDMSEGQYWVSQILLYLGLPTDWVAQDERVRPALVEKLKLRVLSLAGPMTLADLYKALVTNSARWTDAQESHARTLVQALGVAHFDLSEFGFKENGVQLIAGFPGIPAAIADATDVLRLAAALSEADVALRETIKFRKFARPERRKLLGMLEGSKNLEADVGLRPELFKKLLALLHPGDFKFAGVQAVYDKLYRGAIVTLNAMVEASLQARDASVLTLLAARPGDFARRLHTLYGLFGDAAVQAFLPLTEQLETSQLLKLRGYLLTVNDRKSFLYPPRGSWSKVQLAVNEKSPFAPDAQLALRGAIDAQLAIRLRKVLPEGVDLAPETVDIKLQTNDQKLAPYGRGTVFQLPPEATFVRTASYWEHTPASGHSWFDNGWTFHKADWSAAGAICWNQVKFGKGAAVFSGDPTNGHELKGRACQMIDLDIERLKAAGVRYAVWNVLCFSHVAFSEAKEVLATLQWGEDKFAGKLYEPARAQMVFPLQGNNPAKYVAYIDLATRRLVYMDADLPADVSSAAQNVAGMAKLMPAFAEYLDSLPSVADLFANAEQGTTPVLYSDADRAIELGSKAYVFQPENPDNNFVKLALTDVL
jgi:hypothetical protein